MVFDFAVKDISLSVLIAISSPFYTAWLLISGKGELLDSLKYNAFAGIEVGRDSGCWSLSSKVSKMLPNIDVGIKISVVTTTLKLFGLVIDDESMSILCILCVASEAVLCSTVAASLQLYKMIMSLFIFTSEWYEVIPSSSSRCVTWRCCFIFCSALSTYWSWKLFFCLLENIYGHVKGYCHSSARWFAL